MIVKEVPAPSGNINHPTQALIFDSFYDSYRGVVVFVRIKEGSIRLEIQLNLWLQELLTK